MDIFVQSLATGKLLANELRWTAEPSESIVFHSTLDALDFCKANRLVDVRLILKFEGGDRYDLNLPVPAISETQPDSPA